MHILAILGSKSNLFNKIVVSTNSLKYAKIAKKYGAEVPFIRPKEISGDLSTDFECIKHCVDWLNINEKYIPDIIVQLRPTQPNRKVSDIDKAKELLADTVLYVNSNHWFTEEGPVWEKKYIPVKITQIGLGDSYNPVKIVFKPEGYENEFYRNVSFSGINPVSEVLSESFAKFFSWLRTNNAIKNGLLSP